MDGAKSGDRLLCPRGAEVECVGVGILGALGQRSQSPFFAVVEFVGKKKEQR
jgi:hypothetical protein